jgi:hypothetical protein
MAKLFYVKARKDIYEQGFTGKHILTTGKNKGTTVEKNVRTLPADENDKILIHKGEMYYHWAFRFGPTHISKDYPRRSQLTQSAFLGSIYDLEDEIEAIESTDIDEDVISGWVSTLEELRDQCQESLDNMPEGLQQGSSSGELLQERIDNLESWISELENVDPDFDEEAARAEIDEDEKDKDSVFEDVKQTFFDDIKDSVISSNPGF